MDYNLAKKLKDAGFKTLFSIPVSNSDNGLYYPTLEELIEECGDSFWSIKQDGTNQWEADDAQGVLSTKGSTPTEAVAKLYLELHAKRNI